MFVTSPTETNALVTSDGARLATDVYLPARPGRVPAVLARTPYGKAANPVWFPAIGQLFAENGIAFMAQDTRGHSGSDGSLTPFVEEADAWATCDWIVRQPWSNGSIGVFGESYVGFTAISAAASGHPAIRAAALRNTATDIRGDWLRHQGVLRLEFVVRWSLAAWTGAQNLAPDLDWSIRPLAGVARAALQHDRLPAVLNEWARGRGPARTWAGDAGWPSLIDRVRVPTHLTTGWWDLFVRGAIADHARLASRPGVESLLVAEPTDHAGHDWGDGPTSDPLADFDLLASRMPVVLANEVAFLRRHLLGSSTPAVAPASWMLTHAGMQQSATWPPPDVHLMTMHLVDGGQAKRGPEGGGLSVRPDRIPASVTWRHDPSNFVPSLEGEAIDGWFRRPDERQTQVRDDVLTFTSDPLSAPLDLAGPVVAELVVRPPRAGGHVVAKLCDVYPEGAARRISDGTCLLEPGTEEVRVRVVLGDTGYRIKVGHRLRLEISSSAFPRYIGHPGTSEDPWDALRGSVADHSLTIGADASCLHLSVRGIATTPHTP